MGKEYDWRGDSPYGLWRFGREFITVGCDALKADRKRHPRLDCGPWLSNRWLRVSVSPSALDVGAWMVDAPGGKD